MLRAPLTDTRQTSRLDRGPGTCTVHLLHHTHWDREWWAPFQAFRILLADLIDDLLDVLDENPAFRAFLLDSQMIVLRDYLEVRPEQRERLLGSIRSGRVQSGPWYVLPDEFLVSGESHIRNLLLGRRTGSELKVPIQAAGYLPDSFGHIGQMPQILRGFGIDNAFIWRGRGGDPDTVDLEFNWESPDGSSVLTHWFPAGYYQMPFLHFNNPARRHEDKLGRVRDFIQTWAPRASTGALLMPYGGDHRPVDAALPAKLASAADDIADLGTMHWSTLPEFAAAVREGRPDLVSERGEFRQFGPHHPHLLPGVLSSRLYLKQRNFWAETWLERYAEPLAALAWLDGARYDEHLLWKGWELLIQNHPHDSICGCSIDQVHREMLPRFDQSRQIAEIIAERATQYLNSRIDTSDLGPADRAIVVHNTLPYERSGWASVWLDRAVISPSTHRLIDSLGNEVPFQAQDVEGLMPLSDRWLHTEIGFIASLVPGAGYRTFRLTERDIPASTRAVQFTAVQPTASLKGSEAVTDLRVGRNTLENHWIRVEVDVGNGTISLIDRSSGEIYSGLNCFEDGGDAGDSYAYSEPLVDRVLHSADSARVHVSVAEAGYGRATLRIDLDWELPASLAVDRRSRSSTYVAHRVSTFVTLLAASRRVEVRTEWENQSDDHRLRVLFPLGAPVDASHALGQFEVVKRGISGESGLGWPEAFVPTMPQQGWVAVQSGSRGLIIANHGLPEYQVVSAEQGVVALTVLRAVGWLSREDGLGRVGGAGATIPTPDAQSRGSNSVTYAIIPTGGDWQGEAPLGEAESFLVPLYGSSTTCHPGIQAWDAGRLQLSASSPLLSSALKRSEDGTSLVLRVWNPADAATLTLRTTMRVTGVRELGLNEEPRGDWMPASEVGGSIRLLVGSRRIFTLAVSTEDPPANVRPIESEQ